MYYLNSLHPEHRLRTLTGRKHQWHLCSTSDVATLHTNGASVSTTSP